MSAIVEEDAAVADLFGCENREFGLLFGCVGDVFDDRAILR